MKSVQLALARQDVKERDAAYGWPADLPKEEIFACLLALNRERSNTQTK
ncbi:MAG: hypothetical protein ABSE96_09530 [Terracidiphilus sp.]|jgi:hypothetical protein